jgi:hypothetical protein
VPAALRQLGELLARRAWLDQGGRLHAEGIERVRYTLDGSDPVNSPRVPEVSTADTPPIGRTAYVRFAAFQSGEIALAGGYPHFGPVFFDAARGTVTCPGAARLRFTVDGTYPVPVRPDWALAGQATTLEGETLRLPSPAPAVLHLVPIVLREDGKEALGDVYRVSTAAGAEPAGQHDGSVAMVPPLAAVEDVSGVT